MGATPAADWRPLYGDLRRQIEAGDLMPGSRLPRQKELAERYNVPRHVVRRALAGLCDDQVVVSWRGKGSFVRDAPVEYPITSRTRFAANVFRAGHAGDTRFLTSRRIPAPAIVAKLLGISRRDPVLIAEVLRLIDGRPAVLGRHYYDPRRFPHMLERLRRTCSVTQAFAELGLGDFLRAETLVETRLPTPAEAVLLQIPPSQPVLAVIGKNVDPLGSPVEVSQAIARGDRIQLAI